MGKNVHVMKKVSTNCRCGGSRTWAGRGGPMGHCRRGGVGADGRRTVRRDSAGRTHGEVDASSAADTEMLAVRGPRGTEEGSQPTGIHVVDMTTAVLRQKGSSREAHGSGEIATMRLLKRRPRRDAGQKDPEGSKDSAGSRGFGEGTEHFQHACRI